jgi:5S rRNA maturation endonuclease (ribonuclease M5)
MMAATRLDATAIKDQARGKWRGILTSLGMALPATAKQHGPCPTCGGKDRFLFDDVDGRGTWFCNQCIPQAGDGLALVQNVRGCDFPHALKLVADALGYQQCNGDTPRKIIATYDYTDASGTILFQAVRYVPKDFSQRRPNGHGGWIWNLTGIEPVLYKLPEVLAASSVMIVEGEKDVETAYGLGLPEGWAATCNPMGAGKWRESYSDALQGKHVVILPDADAPGEKHAVQMAQSLQGKAATVLRLTLPDGCKDLSEWAEAGGTASTFHALLNNAQPFVFVSAPKTGPPHESNFSPLHVTDFLDVQQEEDKIEWVLEDYLPEGGLVLIAGKPKEGKTTLTYELAVKVARGLPFLNRATQPVGVLILGLEEHPRDMRLRLRSLGADDTLTNLFVFSGSLSPTPDTFEQLKRFILDKSIRLVVVDTLGVFWNVRDENDAAEVQRAIKPFLTLARESGACVLLIHHARKSEGQHGDEIRGSGALFAAVDVALILKRHEVQTQRKLNANSRYPETPTDMILDLTDAGYVLLGDPAQLNRQAKREKMKAALTTNSETAKVLAQRAGVSLRDAQRLLDDLAEHDTEVERKGKGRKGDPYHYRKHSIHATPPVLGGTLRETNLSQMTFDSCDPPSPCTKGIPFDETEEVIDCDA